MVETSPSSSGGESSIPPQEARIPYALPSKKKKKKQTIKNLRNDIVTNSIKTLKMVHIKKKKKKKKLKEKLKYS